MFAPFAAAGVSLGVGIGLHAVSLGTAPPVFLVLRRNARRHRERIGVWLGGIGATLLVVHLGAHFVTPGVPWPSAIADQVGAVLLVSGAIDWRAMRRWQALQRATFLAVAQGATG